ncbi:MAG: response regulator [Elusimicrobiota bacterium]|nr:response regulator [Elusimicrobiota bacterium]
MAEEIRLRVIAIDDDESILETYEAVLSAVYEVKTFSNPKQAKEFLDSAVLADIPDVILMDIMMPGISGLVLMTHIHSMPSTAHVPVIAVSGKSDPAAVKDALLFGAVDFVAKPFEFVTLRAKIKKAFEASR